MDHEAVFQYATKVKESAHFNPRPTSNKHVDKSLLRVSFCSCNLLNTVEVVICKF
ncbi:hypothetical protein CR513_38055 [Mucuna pruriens]|uniref:Uncharacterized protein n=1 Tax=Mucuna pruriens TaxID=157652 RepID=A0A371FTA3_MUCPR|nr:hypothetical protein CR513_38055 [Mucuna pruriens]